MAESQIREEEQKRASAEESLVDTRDQLAGVKSALGSQVMELDGQLKTSQQQCSQLSQEKVRGILPLHSTVTQTYNTRQGLIQNVIRESAIIAYQMLI